MPKLTRTVVITGGTAGIGRATARAFAEDGTQVAVLARDRARLKETHSELESYGVNALAFAVDVADAEAVFAAADQVATELGSIDVWVNNAMTTVLAQSWEITPQEFERITAVTYLGVVYGTLAALKHMRPRNSGVIIPVGSALSSRAIPLQSAYSAAKHAARGFTDSVRSELLHTNSSIKLCMVQLPAHNTPQFDWMRNKTEFRAQPVPPIYQPEVAARAILAASYNPPRELVVGLPAAAIILGQALAPQLLDYYLAKTAYSSQQTTDPIPPEYQDNLFRAVAGSVAARGRFNEEASEDVVPLRLTTHFSKIIALSSLVLLLILALFGGYAYARL
jgi:NAD(P)-dependent dehydrogenase (short-subunit alcohol dehydrogenase family)